jgi:hypothetical protein
VESAEVELVDVLLPDDDGGGGGAAAWRVLSALPELLLAMLCKVLSRVSRSPISVLSLPLVVEEVLVEAVLAVVVVLSDEDAVLLLAAVCRLRSNC